MSRHVLARGLAAVVGWLVVTGAVAQVPATARQAPASGQASSVARQSAAASSQQTLLDTYCLTCHNERLRAQGTVPVSFERLDTQHVGADAEVWEQMVRKLRLGMMPPPGRPRPDQGAHDAFVVWLETELDRAAATHPNPGRPAIRRLTTSEYINAIRSLLDIEVDERWLLFPARRRGPGGLRDQRRCAVGLAGAVRPLPLRRETGSAVSPSATRRLDQGSPPPPMTRPACCIRTTG